jgi:hypothetical protein
VHAQSVKSGSSLPFPEREGMPCEARQNGRQKKWSLPQRSGSFATPSCCCSFLFCTPTLCEHERAHKTPACTRAGSEHEGRNLPEPSLPLYSQQPSSYTSMVKDTGKEVPMASAPQTLDPIAHTVLISENRSFDHLLGCCQQLYPIIGERTPGIWSRSACPWQT